MSSPGQKRGSCGHAMAIFDGHAFSARCREKKKAKKEKLPTKTKKSSSATLSSSTEEKFTALEDKWAERFNRLEALLLAKSMEPTFSSDVRVAPSHSPPAMVTRDSEPFFQPANSSGDSQRTGPDSSAVSQSSAGKLAKDSSIHRSSSSERTGPDKVASQQKSAGKLRSMSTSQGRAGPDNASQKHQSTGKPGTNIHRPTIVATGSSKQPVTDHHPSDRPSGAAGSASPTLQKSGKDSISSLDSDSDSQISDIPPVELFAEEGEFSDDQVFEQELPTSFMGWSHIPDMDSSNPSDDNPFAGPKAPVPSKISVQMPTEDYLCRKLAKLNLTMTEGYPSRTTEAGSLPIDHFLRPPKPQTKWYGLYSDQQLDPATVTSWNTGPSKLNNSFGRISRKAALAATPPASRRISQDALHRWERSAREASVVCNQSASFNRCLFKVQGDMNAQLKIIKSEYKGKVSKKLTEAAEELQFLMDFNSNITQAAAKAMEHLTDFVFLTMGNITLTRRDSYLSHLKNGIKPDTFAALRTGPLHIPTLFAESVVKKA